MECINKNIELKYEMYKIMIYICKVEKIKSNNIKSIQFLNQSKH